MPAKQSKPKPKKKKSSTRGKKASQASRGKRTRATRKAPAKATPVSLPRAPLIQLSPERKMDILGVLLAVTGSIVLLSLLPTGAGLLERWATFWKRAFGWGAYLFPITLILLGVWLILRAVERIPPPTSARMLGVALLFFDLITWLHFFLFPQSVGEGYTFAAAGRGGGYVGATLEGALVTALGWWGAAVVLFAFLLIGLVLALDISVVDLFRWIPPLWLRLQDAWDEWRATRRKRPAYSAGVAPDAATTPPLDSPAATAVAHTADEPALAVEPRSWALPPVADILDPGDQMNASDEIDRERVRIIEETLASFGAPAHVVEINRGPTITQFGVEPDFIERGGRRTRVRVGKIAALADDLALALAAQRIRIQAPVPGKGYVGIEVPNERISLVALRDIIESEAFQRLKSPLRIALGQDVSGNAVAADLTTMPHLLVAGATGSGKSVCVNAIVCCLLLHNTPDDLRLLMVDPKRVELTGYNGIPHLLAPVVVEMDRVIGALQWVTREMDSRYQKFAEVGARNLADYNARMVAQGQPRLPYLVVVIDELADLMMLAPDETERTLTRLAQLARATGIHLIVSTQRPSTDVVTGLIKANFPARIAFAVASGVDSRVILDQPGAERLLGRGDMLFQAPDAPAPVRLQGAYVSDNEIARLVMYWRGFSGLVETTPVASQRPVDAPPNGIPLKQKPLWEDMEPKEDLDPLFDEAVALVRRQGRASISMLQRRLRIGYTRAARLIETMEDKGIVSPPQPGTHQREVLDYGPAAPPADEN